MIEIIFLGTVSGVPTKDRNHSAIIMNQFSETKETMLFDCGEGTQRQMLKAGVNFMNINKIFITHWHADHFAGLIPLIQTMNLERRKKPLYIYAPEAERFVSDIIDLGYFGLNFEVIPVDLTFEGSEIKKIVDDDDFEIYSTPSFHTIPSVAFGLFEKPKYQINLEKLKELKLKPGKWINELKENGIININDKEIKIEEVSDINSGIKCVYSGDTKPCKNIENMSKDIDLLIHDGTFLELSESGGKNHADVSQAAQLAKRANVKKLILTHVSRRYTNIKPLEEESQKIFKNTKIAYDFMRVILK